MNKPIECPFCGKAPNNIVSLVSDRIMLRLGCTSCGYSFTETLQYAPSVDDVMKTYEKLVEKWNSRVNVPCGTIKNKNWRKFPDVEPPMNTEILAIIQDTRYRCEVKDIVEFTDKGWIHSDNRIELADDEFIIKWTYIPEDEE
jgi:transcription elongation factor Elf1